MDKYFDYLGNQFDNLSDRMIGSIFNRNAKNMRIGNEGNANLMIFNNTNIDNRFYHRFIDLYSQCDPEKPLIIELTTTGGATMWAYMTAQVLLNHIGHVTIRIPAYALSSGTIIALSADEIVFSHVGCLGPIDPYIYGLNVPTSTSILQDHNKQLPWYLKYLPTSFTNILFKYGEKMLSRISNDHKHMIKKILKARGIRDDYHSNQIYNFFTNTNHHQTPIYPSDIHFLDLDWSIDNNMLKRIHERENTTDSSRSNINAQNATIGSQLTHTKKESPISIVSDDNITVETKEVIPIGSGANNSLFNKMTNFNKNSSSFHEYTFGSLDDESSIDDEESTTAIEGDDEVSPVSFGKSDRILIEESNLSKDTEENTKIIDQNTGIIDAFEMNYDSIRKQCEKSRGITLPTSSELQEEVDDDICLPSDDEELSKKSLQNSNQKPNSSNLIVNLFES